MEKQARIETKNILLSSAIIGTIWAAMSFLYGFINHSIIYFFVSLIGITFLVLSIVSYVKTKKLLPDVKKSRNLTAIGLFGWVISAVLVSITIIIWCKQNDLNIRYYFEYNLSIERYLVSDGYSLKTIDFIFILLSLLKTAFIIVLIVGLFKLSVEIGQNSIVNEKQEQKVLRDESQENPTKQE